MKFKMTLLAISAIAVGVVIAVGATGYRITRKRINVQAAAQIAANSGFNPGYVAWQTEYLNCKGPRRGDTPLNFRIRAVTKEGWMSEVITTPAEGESQRKFFLKDAFVQATDSIRSKITYKRSSSPQQTRLSGLPDPKTGCLINFLGRETMPGARKVGEDKILGHLAYKIVYDTADRRMTQWLLPEVACFPAQIFTEFKDSRDPSNFVSNSFVETTRLVVGEPPAYFMKPPDDFVERSPKEMEIEYWTQKGLMKGMLEADARKMAEERASKSKGIQRAEEEYNKYR